MKPGKKLLVFLFLIFNTIFASGQSMNTIKLKNTTIKIEKQKYLVSKGNILVKSDHTYPNAALIEIPVIIIHTTNKAPKEPIFWLAGGPGVSNMKQKPSKILLENHDFVLVGYRGVDGSVNLKSRNIKKAVKGLNDSLLSNESLLNVQSGIEKYIKDLQKDSINLKNFTIIDVINDLEDVRKSLAYNKINLLSASYGTRVALLYGYCYPNAINRSVMVGVNPPGHFVWWPQKTEQIISEYDSILQSKGEISDGLTINKSIELSFSNIPKRWTLFKLDAEKIKATSFVLMYRKQSAVMVFDAYKRAATKGDYSGLYLMQLAYDYLVPGMFTWGDLFNKGASADLNRNINYKELLKPEKTKIGAPLSLLIWGGGEKWPDITIEEEYKKAQYSLTETLMIGGNLDISTPPEYAAGELLPIMPNAKQIILKDMAHVDDLMYLQRDAFNSLISTYYDTGKVDSTLFSDDTVEFKTPVSFNGIAKVLYPVVFVMSIFK